MNRDIEMSVFRFSWILISGLSLSHTGCGCKFSGVIIRAVMNTTKTFPPIGSQQFLDQLALVYHREIAARLMDSPVEVIGLARENLRRWIQVHEGTGTVYALKEWQILLDTKSIPELVAIITEDSDEGQRLRQSTPFAGVLSDHERTEIMTLYEERAFA